MGISTSSSPSGARPTRAFASRRLMEVLDRLPTKYPTLYWLMFFSFKKVDATSHYSAVAPEMGARRRRRSNLLGLDAGVLDHARPFLHFRLNEALELLLITGCDLQTHAQHALLDLGLLQNLVDFLVAPFDARLVGACRHHESVPAGSHHVGQALILQWLGVGVDCAGLLRRHAQYAQLAGFNMRQRCGDGGQRGIEPACNQIGVGRDVALVLNDHALYPCIAQKQLL